MNIFDLDGVLVNLDKAIEEYKGLENVPPEVWFDLEEYPWTQDFVPYIDFVCTAPWDDLSCAGKSAWIRTHLGLEKNQWMICRSKWIIARSDRLLIDDHDKNCTRFVGAGGRAFLFDETRVEELLRRLRG